MREALNECYERFGRFLNPDIGASPIQMGGANRYKPFEGVCSRTGVEGQIVNHHKSNGSTVAIHTKLLWMIAYQTRVQKSAYRLSFGCIGLTADAIFSTDAWACREDTTVCVPGLQVLPTKQIIRALLGQERYLLVCFGKNTDRVLANGLRYSSGTCLEINGEAKLAGLDMVNQTVDFGIAKRLAAFGLDWDQVRRYCDLRNRAALSPVEQVEMRELRAGFGDHGAVMVKLSRQVSRQDLRLARWLAND